MGAAAWSTTPTQLGISDAVTFHGHVDDDTKHAVLPELGARAAVPQGGLGSGGHRGRAARGADRRLPVLGGLTDSIVDGVTGVLVDDYDGLVDGLERLLSDEVLREQLGAKAAVRSGEFSWRQSADAMRMVLESMHAGRHVSGVV